MTDLPTAPDEWYHSIELPAGRTPGLFDLDRVRDAIEWPDLSGARCLDLATYDGYWAFELERRGAAEVVALDLGRSRDFDWAPRHRHRAHDVALGAGFRHAAAALGSQVRRVEGNVYTLTREELGSFDVVLLGALLLHLSSPFAALERIRQLCTGHFVSIEQVDERSSLLLPRHGVLALGTEEYPWVWGVPNRAGHRRMLHHAGFDVVAQAHSVMAFGEIVDDERRRRAAGRLRHRVARRLLRLPDVPGLWASAIVARPDPSVAARDDLPVARRRFAW